MKNSMMFFTFLQEESLLFHNGIHFGPREKFSESNSVYELRNAESVISDRFKKTPRFTQTKLYKSLTATKSAKREILVERDLPNATENAVALR